MSDHRIKQGKGYDNDSISALKGEEQVRKRPTVIFGRNDMEGCAHAVFEIISNSIDEAREGYGDTINITVEDDNTVTVEDFGRGVPMGFNNVEGEFNWRLVFCQMYASGKYNEKNYNSSLGLNGLGATATQYASEFMEVRSYREGTEYTMNFKEGKPISELQVKKIDSGRTGTVIRFKPDRRVFSDIEVPITYYLDKLRRQAMLHPGLKVNIKYKDFQKITLDFKNGPKGFIEEVCQSFLINDILEFEDTVTGADDADGVMYKLKMSACIAFSTETSTIEMYHNGSYLSDSYDNVTDKAVRNGVCKALEYFAKSQNLIDKSDKINLRDVEELLIIIGSTDSPGSITIFKGQTKTAVLNPFIEKAYNKFVYESLTRWSDENRTKMGEVVKAVLLNKKARELAEAVKKKVVKKLSSSIDTPGSLPVKFAECRSKNPDIRELYIVEGDSAKGSCKGARDSNFQAIMPIRGKIMNCLKEDLAKILNSEIITDLIKVFGCGIEVKSKHIKDLPKFDMNKLNWNKIIICTDADVDGMQIRCLIIAMIYRLMPTLLEQNKVFIAETPLFEITYKGGYHFAYSDRERDAIVDKLVKSGMNKNRIKINRSKGLGENTKEMMSISTMSPATRRLIPVEYKKDDKATHDIFNALLGTDIESRRFMIDEYFIQLSNEHMYV